MSTQNRRNLRVPLRGTILDLTSPAHTSLLGYDPPTTTVSDCGAYLLQIVISVFRRSLVQRTVSRIAQYSLLFVVLAGDVLAQNGDPRFGHLSVEQGLSFSHVQSIYQDNDGFMWFGTPDGLNRYDGYNFKVYKHDPLDSNSISNNPVSQIYGDKSGAMWIVAAGELNRLDRATEKFRHYPGVNGVLGLIEDHSGQIWIVSRGNGLYKNDRGGETFKQFRRNLTNYNSLSSDTLFSILEDRSGVLWIGTTHGLNSFDNSSQQFKRFERGPIGNVYVVFEDNEKFGGFLWIGADDGLYRYDRLTMQFSLYRHNAAEPSRSKENHVRTIYRARNGALWIGTDAGLSEFNSSTGRLSEIESDDPAQTPRTRVASIIEDEEGSLWLGGSNEMLTKLERGKRLFTRVRTSWSPVAAFNVHSMFRDRTGTLWFGTTSSGLITFDKAQKPFQFYTSILHDSTSLDFKAVGGILEDRSGVLWVATPLGLNKLNVSKDGKTTFFTHYTFDATSPTIWPVLEDRKGLLWLGSVGGGLVTFDPRKETFVVHRFDQDNPHSLSDSIVTSLHEDKSGTFWLGTGAEILDEFHPESQKVEHHSLVAGRPNIVASAQLVAIHEDAAGSLWIGTRGCGLLRFDHTTGRFDRYVNDPKRPNSLSSNWVDVIVEDSRGTLWIGTWAGLDRFERGTESFSSFTVKDGLASDHIGGILEDNHGRLWLNTSKGISRFDPVSLVSRNYDEGDGVGKGQYYAPSGFKNRNGEMFFGGINGFVRFFPDSIKDNPHVPPIVITAFKKFDKLVSLDTAISEKRLIELSYKENVFSFEFAALNYTSPEKNQYAYKLVGFDDDWVYCGTRRYATYTNLDGGKYIFRVKGSNNDGVWNEEGASIAVVIAPPFWSTWWFRAFALVVFFGSIGGTVRYIEIRKMKRTIERLEQERALERERSRISEDMHDEVGANLTKIAIISELAMTKAGIADGMTSYLQNISQTARDVVDSISAIVWAINPQNDRLDNLAGYLREYASGYFEITPITCRFDFPGELPNYPLSAETRRNIFLTMKEAINNIVKHSSATAVQICLRISGRQVELSIEDNGKGFVMEDISKFGNGLINMRKRIENIGGSFDIHSQLESGTRIRLIVPVGQEIPLS